MAENQVSQAPGAVKPGSGDSQASGWVAGVAEVAGWLGCWSGWSGFGNPKNIRKTISEIKKKNGNTKINFGKTISGKKDFRNSEKQLRENNYGKKELREIR